MPVHRIDHINLNSSDVDRTIAFYTGVLGFTLRQFPVGDRTANWLCLDDHAYVHLTPETPDAANGPERVDHFALQATGVDEIREKLKAAGVPFQENTFPQMQVHQINVKDPDGVLIELNFRTA